MLKLRPTGNSVKPHPPIAGQVPQLWIFKPLQSHNCKPQRAARTAARLDLASTLRPPQPTA